MKKYNVLGISVICIIIYIMLSSGTATSAVEKTDIPVGIGADLINNNTGIQYELSASVYTFNKPNEISSIVIEGNGNNFPNTRETRQQMSTKIFKYGLEKIFIYSEKYASAGITSLTDMMLSNQDFNDMGWAVVCKGNAIDMLKYKVDSFPASSDYIAGMVESSPDQNFLSSNYKIMDVYVMLDSEGRNLVLPYFEILNNNITLSGMAIFKKDRMVKEIPIKEAKYMNILREDNVKGILTLQKNVNQWASIEGIVKRKVQCFKVNGKYRFVINVNFTSGRMISNTLYDDVLSDPKTLIKYTHELEEDTQKKCNLFIQKMQTDYKVDCLQLGRVAAAKYGRNSGVDWDKIVSNSQISVKVKVNINNLGRGTFTSKN